MKKLTLAALIGFNAIITPVNAELKDRIEKDCCPLNLDRCIALSQMQFYARNYEESIKHAKNAIEFDDQDPRSYHYLAQNYNALKKFTKALEYEQKSLMLARDDEDRSNSYAGIACIAASMGSKDRAYRFMARANALCQKNIHLHILYERFIK